jgi:hypothetical protein
MRTSAVKTAAMKTIVNNAISDSMFAFLKGETLLTRRPLTPQEARAIIDSGVETAFNPSHANTARAVERKTGVRIPIAGKPARVSLGIGDRLLVVSLAGSLPRETREFTDDELDRVNFVFSLWTVLGTPDRSP